MAPTPHLLLVRAAAFALAALLSAPTLAADAAPVAAAAPEPAFDIWEYAIEGNTVLPVPAIEAAVTPHLGPGRQMKDVEAARQALEAAYQKAGFLTVLVDIPEQRIADGVVRLAVLEGRVGALYVTGSRWHDQGVIRQRASGLTPGEVPDFKVVQAQLDDLNRTPARRVQPVLKPGVRPGTVDVDLQVNDQMPVSGSVEVNNQHAAGTTPSRVVASLRHDNLFEQGHTLAVTAQVAPQKPSESRVFMAAYTVPTDAGRSWVANLVSSNSDVDTLGGTQVLGRGTTLGLRHVWPVGASGSLSLGADVKWLQERAQFGALGIDTPLRYMPWQVAYFDQWELDWARVQWQSSLTFASQHVLGGTVICPLASGGMGPQDQFACKRQGASGSFAALKFDLRVGVPLRHLDEHLAALGQVGLRMAGQYSGAPLVSSEQFSVGGADTVRGYPEGSAVGDSGLLGSAEWRLPSLFANAAPLRELTPLAFVDAARVEIENPGPGLPTRVPLLGVGLGLRFALDVPLLGSAGSADGALDVAWPHRTVATAPGSGPRWHVRLTGRF